MTIAQSRTVRVALNRFLADMLETPPVSDHKATMNYARARRIRGLLTLIRADIDRARVVLTNIKPT